MRSKKRKSQISQKITNLSKLNLSESKSLGQELINEAISKALMVDVSAKEETLRRAEAQGIIKMSPETLKLILENKIPKGNVLTTAKIAGIQAAKKTAELLPLCHPLRLTSIEVEINPQEKESSFLVTARVIAFDRTGVEMEALTAVVVACLTIYDMAKAFDKRMMISDIHLLSKQGGKSGNFKW